MILTIGIDPGVHACGLGIVMGTELVYASLVRATGEAYHRPELLGALVAQEIAKCAINAGRTGRIVIEYPQSYVAGSQKGDQNDLIRLALVAGACGGALEAHGRGPVEFIYPRVWKGTTDADVFTKRIEKRLEVSELPRIMPCPESLRHNVLDGIGIALWACGRLDRRRVYDND